MTDYTKLYIGGRWVPSINSGQTCTVPEMSERYGGERYSADGTHRDHRRASGGLLDPCTERHREQHAAARPSEEMREISSAPASRTSSATTVNAPKPNQVPYLLVA